MNGNPSSLDKSIDSKDDDKSESEQYLNPSSPDNELAIFVYNIDPEVPQDQFKTIFGSFGSITKLTYNSVTPTKPFVYILYERPESADKALKEAQYMQIGRLEILVCKRQEGSKLNPRGKLFVRGIADEITLRDLHQHFGQVSFNFLVFKFGPQDLRPLNTGFVHFFDPKDAQKALDTFQNKEVKESKLELSEWDPQGLKRAKASQSLYIANLPDMSKRDIESQYMAIFKSFGEIVSFIFNDVKFNGVLAYKEHKDAQEAFENLTKKEGCAGLSVSWVKSASERKEEMKKRKNRLHLDGLRFDISHEMIKSEFGRFGQVVSLDTKPGRIVERRIKTQWAVIAFSTDEEAERAIIDGPRTREIKKLFVMNYLKIQYLGQPNKDQSPNHSHNNNNPNRMNKNQYFSKSKPQSLHETTPKAHPDSHPELSEPQESQFPPGMQPFSGSQPLIPFDEQLPPHMIQPQAQHFNQPMMFSHMLGQPQPQPQPQVQYSPFNFMQMNPPQFPSLSQPPMMNMSPSAQNSQPQGFIQPPPGFNLMGNPSLGNPTPQFPGLGGWPQQDEVLNNNRISNSLNNNEFFNLSNLGNLGNIMPPMNNFHGAGDIGQPQKNILDPGYGDLVEGAELNDQIMFNLSFMDEKPAEPIKPTQPIQSTQTTQPTEPLNVGSINPEDFLKKSLGIM